MNMMITMNLLMGAGLLDISNGWKTAIMIVAIILVFWFFLIRPQSQQLKKEQEYRNGLKRGDKVMTSSGIHVTVMNIDGGEALVEAAPNVRFKVHAATLTPIPQYKESK